MITHPRPKNSKNPKKKLGLVHVYTGEGKGKTTAALGTMMRAAGHGYTSLMVRFLRGYRDTGEMKVMPQFKGLMEILAFAQDEPIDLSNPLPFDKHLAIQGLNYARQIMHRKRPDILVLDEINPAMHYGLLEVKDILDFLDNKHQETEIILTGRYAPAEILNYADLVTVMQPIKHYYDYDNFEPRWGIEH